MALKWHDHKLEREHVVFSWRFFWGSKHLYQKYFTAFTSLSPFNRMDSVMAFSHFSLRVYIFYSCFPLCLLFLVVVMYMEITWE